MNEIIEAKGFTPVFDTVAGAVVGNKKMGLVGAAVYGIVWRHCQMRRKVCDAAIETMADQLGVSRKTVQRHLKGLCDLGYINDLTPDRRNGPHTYITTDKVTFRVTIEAGEQDPGETESPTDNPVGQRVPPVGQRVPPPVGQRVPQGDSFKDTKKDTSEESGEYEPGKVAAAHTHRDSSSSSTAKKEGLQNHPAIKAIYERTGKYPVRDAQKKVLSVVGDSPAGLSRWADVLDYFISQGWHILNPIRALDRFENGEIPARAQQDLHKGDPGYSLDISTGKYVPKKNGSAKYFVDPDTGERIKW